MSQPVGRPLWVGRPWAGVPGSKEQAERALGSKPVSTMPLWPLHSSCLQVSDDEQGCGRASQINPFLSTLLWSWRLVVAVETLTKTVNNLVLEKHQKFQEYLFV